MSKLFTTKQKADRFYYERTQRKAGVAGNHRNIYCPACRAGFRDDTTYRQHYKAKHAV